MDMVKMRQFSTKCFQTSVKLDWMSVLQLQLPKVLFKRKTNILNAWIIVQYSISFVRFAKYFGASLGK